MNSIVRISELVECVKNDAEYISVDGNKVFIICDKGKEEAVDTALKNFELELKTIRKFKENE